MITDLKVNVLWLYTSNIVGYTNPVRQVSVLQSTWYNSSRPKAITHIPPLAAYSSAHHTAVWHDYQVINAVIHYVYGPLGLNPLHGTRVLVFSRAITWCLLRLCVFTLRIDNDARCIQNHYIDAIMTTMSSQITSLTVVYSTVYSDADQRKHQSSASLAFLWGNHRSRWIPRTNVQLRGKCFHLMTSSWIILERRRVGNQNKILVDFISYFMG